MAKKLLIALGYPDAESINIKEENTYRKIVSWLESNKIKRARPEIAKSLANINSSEWQKNYEEYKNFLGCPKSLKSNEESLQWLAGYAIQEDYGSKKHIYTKQPTEDSGSKNIPNVKAESILDNLDFHSNEFIEGINKIAKLLNITPHPEPQVTLKAVKHIITKRLTPDALKNPQQYIIKGTPFPLQDADLGFDLGDPVLSHAAKILRMLYIQDLRDLQTKANELIVSAQNVTANPKTDTRLGKVGF